MPRLELVLIIIIVSDQYLVWPIEKDTTFGRRQKEEIADRRKKE
jgi:hypothetical protein